MELCEKERNVDLRGCIPFVVMEGKAPRSCQGHPGSKAGLGPRAPHSPCLSIIAHEGELVSFTPSFLPMTPMPQMCARYLAEI